LDFKFWSIFDRFWLPTWTLRTPFGTSGLAFTWFFRFSAHIDLGSNFGAKLAPFSISKPGKILPKIDFETHKKFDWFLMRFLPMLALFWDPTWGHVGEVFGQNSTKNPLRGTQTPPGAHQEAPKRPPGGSKSPKMPPRRPKCPPRCPQEGPKRPQEAPKMPPRGPQEIPKAPPRPPILVPFWIDFRSAWVPNKLARRYQGVSLLQYISIYIYI